MRFGSGPGWYTVVYGPLVAPEQFLWCCNMHYMHAGGLMPSWCVVHGGVLYLKWFVLTGFHMSVSGFNVVAVVYYDAGPAPLSYTVIQSPSLLGSGELNKKLWIVFSKVEFRGDADEVINLVRGGVWSRMAGKKKQEHRLDLSDWGEHEAIWWRDNDNEEQVCWGVRGSG